MNLLDLLVLGILLLAGLVGFRLGLLRPGLAWLGVAPGLYVAVLMIPRAQEWLDPVVQEWHPLAYPLGVHAVLLVAGALAGHLIGHALGRLLHLTLPEALRYLDRFAGLVVATIIAGTLLWLLAPTIATTPGWFAEVSEGSLLLRFSLETLPSPPEGLNPLVAWVRLNAR